MLSNRIKRLLAAGIVLMLVVSMSGCERPAARTPGKEDTFTIVASFYPIYISILNITRGVSGVQVKCMASPRVGCLHDYQLTTRDMKTLEQADVFVINGAGMESFLAKVIEQYPDLKIIEASRGIKLIKNSQYSPKNHNDEECNPHVWVSISGNIQEVENIGAELAKLDPRHAAQYRENTRAYVSRLTALRDRMHAAIDKLPNRDVVTFHEAFPYFAREFGLNIVAVVEREPGSEPGAGELAEIIETVRKTHCRVIFAEPQYSARAADIIARETGARVYELDPAVTGPDSPDAYLQIMEKNLKVLEEALQ